MRILPLVILNCLVLLTISFSAIAQNPGNNPGNNPGTNPGTGTVPTIPSSPTTSPTSTTSTNPLSGIRRPIPKLPTAECGARDDEKIETPEVNCDDNDDLMDKIDEYFQYTPPVSNISALTNDAKQQINIKGVRDPSKPKGHRISSGNSSVDCNTITNNNPLSEPCQDNRWRDTCLIGVVPPDLDYALYQRPVYDDEEPWPGVIGAKPLYDRFDFLRINCMIPKNTERLSALRLDNGWRFRHSCPNDPSLQRIERDVYRNKTDLFRGITTDSGQSLFNCWAPLPKCDLKSDWKIGNTNWAGADHGKYVNIFKPASTNPITGAINSLFGGLIPSNHFHTLEQLLSRFETTAHRDAAIQWLKNDLLKPDTHRAAECKPAYWARLMMDSCANQFIAQKSFSPTYTFTAAGREAGISSRMCQPLKTVDVVDHEYDPHDYLKRTANGLLHADYMPHMEYQRFEKPFVDSGWKIAMATRGYPKQGKIKGLGMNRGGQLMKTADGFGNPDINQYAATNVERILDAAHPFSPRYDIMQTVVGDEITDRTLFKGETESEASTDWLRSLCGYPCKPDSEGEGYFEFDETVYCSAVPVDLLRFRYADYRICMGCHIDTNEKAFWKEVDNNREHYEEKRCGVGVVDIFKKSDYDDCIYCTAMGMKEEICGSCHRAAWNAALFAGCCVLTFGTCIGCDDFLEKAIKYYLYCELFCKPSARNEALEGARQQRNEVAKPIWGPTGMGKMSVYSGFKNLWPVCSTRFDWKGSDAYCKMAKTAYGACAEQAGKAALTDPNMPIAPMLNRGRKCATDWSIEDICHNAAKPVAPLNLVKMRVNKGHVATDQPFSFTTKKWQGESSTLPTKMAGYNALGYEKPAKALDFRHYFKSHRPYMRWWDTGQEAFQTDTKPDYWCDFASNTMIPGIGREANSIHGLRSQLCRYGGGDGIDGDCFKMDSWNKRYPELAGSEWAELKMYQARCFRRDGLNCLCQYEKMFKDESSEEFVLKSLAGRVPGWEYKQNDGTTPPLKQVVNAEHPWGWRGYASTPIANQQFPNLYGVAYGKVIKNKGLSFALPNDVIIWPAGLSPSTLPRVAIVREANTRAVYETPSGNIFGNRKEWVLLRDANNGKFPDACGNTSMLGYGPDQTVYPDLDALGHHEEKTKKMLEEQISSTYYCDDPYLRHCVDRHWNDVIIFRPDKTVPLRKP